MHIGLNSKLWKRLICSDVIKVNDVLAGMKVEGNWSTTDNFFVIVGLVMSLK